MYHKITLVGYLGRDPVARYSPRTGKMAACFPVASNRKYTDAAGALIEETSWFRVVAWGRQADVCLQFLHKSRLVLIEGRLISDRVSGGPRAFLREDHTPGATYEICAEMVRFLDRNGIEEGASPAAEAESTREPILAPMEEVVI